MTSSRVAQAIDRAEQAFRRKPGLALGDDMPVRTVLGSGLHCALQTPAGETLRTAMPAALGGDDDGVTPGWLMRAGMASGLATAVARPAAVYLPLRVHVAR